MKTKEVIKIVGNAVIWLIFGLALLAVIFSFNSTGGVPNIFGTGYLTVQSDSMSPAFNPGDLIIVDVITDKERTIAEENNEPILFEVDDVVTFRTVIGGEQVLNTHRIISYSTIANIRYYTTQGDNVAESDLATITSGDIVAKWTGKKMSGLGSVIDYIQSRTGFLICVVIPLAAIFIYQIINFAIVIARYRDDGSKTSKNLDLNNLTAEQQEEIAKKYLESLNSKKEKEEDNS